MEKASRNSSDAPSIEDFLVRPFPELVAQVKPEIGTDDAVEGDGVWFSRCLEVTVACAAFDELRPDDVAAGEFVDIDVLEILADAPAAVLKAIGAARTVLGLVIAVLAAEGTLEKSVGAGEVVEAERTRVGGASDGFAVGTVGGETVLTACLALESAVCAVGGVKCSGRRWGGRVSWWMVVVPGAGVRRCKFRGAVTHLWNSLDFGCKCNEDKCNGGKGIDGGRIGGCDLVVDWWRREWACFDLSLPDVGDAPVLPWEPDVPVIPFDAM